MASNLIKCHKIDNSKLTVEKEWKFPELLNKKLVK